MKNRLLSFCEERLWRAEQEDADATAFVECPRHVASIVRLIGGIDVKALAASINEVVRRHEVLRSTFVNGSGPPMRVVTPFAEMAIAETALDVAGDRDRERAVRETLAECVRRPFDLAAGPLVRAQLLRLGEHEHVLALIVHHIVFDGWSVQVVWRELAALYEAFASGRPSPLPELKRTYADYVAWQRSRLEGDRLHTLAAYWTNQLSGAPELVVPSDRPRTVHTTNRAGRERFTISTAQADGTRKLCRERGVTSGVAMATVASVLLHRLTGHADVTLGMPVADRNRPEFDPLVGLFLNLVVLRTDLSNDPTFVDALERVRRTFIGAYDHRDLPYGYLSASRGLDREINMTPLRVVFNYVAARHAAPALPGVIVERIDVDGEPLSFADLSLHLFDRDGALSGFVLYKADLFSSTRIQGFIALFTTLLSDVLDAPELRIGEYQVDLGSCQPLHRGNVHACEQE